MGGLSDFTFLTLIVAPRTYAILFGIKYEAQAPPREHIGSSAAKYSKHPKNGEIH